MMTILFLLMFTMMIGSASAWISGSHSPSPLESTKAGPTTLHAWWKNDVSGDGADDDLPGVSSSSTDSSEPDNTAPTFFIRPALSVDIGRASKILADGFFKDNTNFITFQFERLETYLSLELGFPRPSTRHELFVACEQSTGKVLGVAEVDARTERPTAEDAPYLCNLAVDLSHQRKGIATALVAQCEAQVQEWVYEEEVEAKILLKDNKDSKEGLSCSLHLKVRENNEKAVNMYQKLGYQSIAYESDKKKNKVLILRKQLERKKKKKKENEIETMERVSTTG
ncbi:MAG: hypothetical protein SGBAC_004350 [Bacillariaceae sp.]